MKKLFCAIVILLLFGLMRYTFQMKEERLQIEQLLWVEFDASLHGLIRMLYLAEESPHQPLASLVAAYEHGLILQRLGPVAERLLAWRGIKAEPLAGYLLSLTGGVGSICDEVRLHGRSDEAWIVEIRQRLEFVHSILNADTMRNPNRKQLQKKIRSLFSSELTGIHYTVDVGLPTSSPQCTL